MTYQINFNNAYQSTQFECGSTFIKCPHTDIKFHVNKTERCPAKLERNICPEPIEDNKIN